MRNLKRKCCLFDLLSFWACSALFSFEVGFRDLWVSLLRSSMLRGHDYLPLEPLFWSYSTPSNYSSRGFLSLESFSLGQQRCLINRVVDFYPSNHSFQASSDILSFELWISVPRIALSRPAAPFYCSSCGFWSLESFPLGQQFHCTI
jgi:hypothetical protein